MPNDPIVAELHRVREQLWEECHGSAEEMEERQRIIQRELDDRLIDPEEWRRRRTGQYRKST